MDRRGRGFTLLEILITLLILGIAMSFVAVSVGDFGSSRRVQSAAEELKLLIGLAQQQAILEPSVMGLHIQADQYTFYDFVARDPSQKDQWRPITRDTALYPHFLGSHIQLSIKKGNNHSQLPQIIISPNGNMTSFLIEIGKKNQSPLFQLIGQANGELTLVSVK